ncbi:hypothetical protein AHA02nite_24540 [Alkalibacillus haloalkaliphilus]|uniref:Uncharacterized protein n=1 Tax=Alkalibacillus haloalkaliphilus TaxID=94136 RepID=A0A511W8K4_9BACI|nr:hypothetical protein AHA02nite_24540 [Alkalibacillus haloalkaliphilus]
MRSLNYESSSPNKLEFRLIIEKFAQLMKISPNYREFRLIIEASADKKSSTTNRD